MVCKRCGNDEGRARLLRLDTARWSGPVQLCKKCILAVIRPDADPSRLREGDYDLDSVGATHAS